MFNIVLEEKSNKMSFKALSLKVQRSKNRQGGGRAQCGHGADRKEKKTKNIKLGVVLNLER